MKKILPMMIALSLLASGCGQKATSKPSDTTQETIVQGIEPTPSIANFHYVVEQFADLEIMRYRVMGIENLSLKQQELLYDLSQAALCGRDILYDQNGAENLVIRTLLENIYTSEEVDKTSEAFKALTVYLKRVWFSNGIHHHYSGDKFVPQFSKEYFVAQVKALPQDQLPLKKNQTLDDLLSEVLPEIFDPSIDPIRTNQDASVDVIKHSGVNYYDKNVTQQEAEDFYAKMKANHKDDAQPISYGLNSRLVKEDGVVKEEVYKVGGLYSSAITPIVSWLKKAEQVAETEHQKNAIADLISWYETGDLKAYNDYCIKWVQDTSTVDFVNGFTENYGDPLGMKGAWESLVNFKNEEATHRSETVSRNAQWFEDNSPTDKRFKKEEVKGVTAKVITAAMLGGDCYPATPIGINLPNANWIRAQYGSKSVSIDNLTEAYAESAKGNGFYEEFVIDKPTITMLELYKKQMDDLHTDLHECLGHGSGKLLPGVDPDALKTFGSTIEEARADIFGLYFVADKKMQELGLVPNDSAFHAMYYAYFMNGLMTQLTRVEPGKNVQEAHMRNRQLITRWILERSAEDHAVEMVQKEGKTYVKINDYLKIRQRCGELLAELQRITSQGDYPAAKRLVETYAIQVDPALHQEVLSRNAGLKIKSFKGFVNPRYVASYNAEGQFTALSLDYTEGYAEQQLRYSHQFGFLSQVK